MAPEDGLGEIGRRITGLREAAGLTKASVARRIHVKPPVITLAEQGRRLSVRTAELLDDLFGTGGELAARRRKVEERGRRHREREVGGTDRREFGGLTLAMILDTAGEASNAMATADPPPLALEEMEAEADAIADRVYDVPAQATLDCSATQWHAAHLLLGRPVSDGARSRLLSLAGSLACQAACAGRILGSADVVRKFGTLAGQYAEASGDPRSGGPGGLPALQACVRPRRTRVRGRRRRPGADARPPDAACPAGGLRRRRRTRRLGGRRRPGARSTSCVRRRRMRCAGPPRTLPSSRR